MVVLADANDVSQSDFTGLTGVDGAAGCWTLIGSRRFFGGGRGRGRDGGVCFVNEGTNVDAGVGVGVVFWVVSPDLIKFSISLNDLC